jgi:hypothetical protein
MLAAIIDLHFSRKDWEFFFVMMSGLLLAIAIYYQS